MQTCQILGSGHAVPHRILTNADLEQMVDTSDAWIVERSGIRQRHIAEPGSSLSDLAADAAKQALDHAATSATEIDLIIVATVSADMKFPAMACLLQEKLGATKAAAFDISAACAGFIYGLHLARSLMQTCAYQRVLVVAAEMLSSMVNWEDRNTCVLFGDGAGAVVLGPAEAGSGILSTTIHSDGRHSKLLYNPAGSQHVLTPDDLKNNFATINMQGREVFRHAVSSMTAALNEALEQAGLSAEELDFIIPHQANNRIIEAIAKRFKVPPGKLIVNVERFGNTSAASIPIALNEAIQNGTIKKGATVGMTTFGAGLTWAAAIIQI